MLKNRIVAALLMIGTAFLISESAHAKGWIIYWDGSYHGKVIDAKTKEPIEGAVVVAIYHESCYRFIQTNLKVIGAEEVLTEADGSFRISSFWTVSTPECWYYYTGFFVFKPGYGTFPSTPIEELPTTQIYLPGDPKPERFPDIFKVQDMFRKRVMIELPRLETKEEMKKYHIFGPSVPDRLDKKLKNYYRLENELDKMLGYE